MNTFIKLAFSTSLLFSTVISCIYSQDNKDNCKVLMNEISESYQGDCKDGLAHGNGLAQGIDTYEGKFKKGLPYGNGKYAWANGDYYDGRWKEGDKAIMLFNVPDNNVRVKKLETRIHKFDVPWETKV